MDRFVLVGTAVLLYVHYVMLLLLLLLDCGRSVFCAVVFGTTLEEAYCDNRALVDAADADGAPCQQALRSVHIFRQTRRARLLLLLLLSSYVFVAFLLL